MTKNLLMRVENLSKHFPIEYGVIFKRQMGVIRAVDDVTIDIYRGETLGLVGESGCGKSTLGRTIAQLHHPTSGHVYFNGLDLCALGGKQLRSIRQRIQLVFQDPYSSLNPRMRIAEIVGEPLAVHRLSVRKEIQRRVDHLLDLVGLDPAFSSRYPHELSGGQRQRVGIARALSLQPELLICDEPISALDISIQAQVINLLEDLQVKLGLTYLFIAHDLSVVRHISRRVVVMYLGKFVELADRNELFSNPLHPYTKALLSAVPIPDPIVEERRQQLVLEGEIPDPANLPSGCRFRTRCPDVQAICSTLAPEWREIGSGHYLSCHIV